MGWVNGVRKPPAAMRTTLQRYIRLADLRDVAAVPAVLDEQMDGAFEVMATYSGTCQSLAERWDAAISRWRKRKAARG